MTVSPPPAKVPPSPGMVWVNPDTKIFHRAGDPWYGKTRNGEWMTPADAVKAGYHEAKPGLQGEDAGLKGRPSPASPPETPRPRGVSLLQPHSLAPPAASKPYI